MTHGRRRFDRILVTGGTGFVGGHLCPRLVAMFPDAERILLTRTGDSVARPGFRSHALDLADRADTDAVVAAFRPDLIMHLAAQAAITAATADKEEAWRTNFEATMRLASAAARHVPDATFLFVSSAEVYGLSFKNGPVAEHTPTQPMNVYARSKLAAEMALADLLPDTATLIIARSFNHTGAGQDIRFVLPAFAHQIAAIEAGRSERVLRVGNLEAERDFLDVQDVCDAYLALINTCTPESREAWNVSSGRAYRIRDLLDQLQQLSGAAFEIVLDPDRMRPSEIARSVGKCEKLETQTGWRPRFDITTTLRAVLDDQRRRLSEVAAS